MNSLLPCSPYRSFPCPGSSVVLVVLIASASLCGCKKPATPVAQEQPKSRAYYSTHLDEAKAVAMECNRMVNNELSTLSQKQRDAWWQTTPGINCTNASNAYAVAEWNAYQQRMADAAKNFDAKPPKRHKP